MPVQPPVIDRYPDVEVCEEPLLDFELPPDLLLPTGTDIDDEPDVRAKRLLLSLCAAHLERRRRMRIVEEVAPHVRCRRRS